MAQKSHIIFEGEDTSSYAVTQRYGAVDKSWIQHTEIPRYSIINDCKISITMKSGNNTSKGNFLMAFSNHGLSEGNPDGPSLGTWTGIIGTSAVTRSGDLLPYINTSGANSGKYNGSYPMIVWRMYHTVIRKYTLYNINISWNFTYPTYTINATTGEGGTVSGNTGTFDVTVNNQTKTVTANPNSGYKFSHWEDGSGNKISTNASYSVTVSHENISANSTTLNLKAVFIQIPKLKVFRSTYIQDGTNGFYVYAYVAGKAESGEEIAPQNGINRVQFPTWTNKNDQDDIQQNWPTNSAASGTNGSWNINDQSYNYRYYVSVSDHNNEYLGYNVHIYPYDNSGNAGEVGTIYPKMYFTATTSSYPANGGTVNPTSTTVEYGTNVTLVATPNLRYNFIHWTDSVGNIVSTNASFTPTIINDITYIAVFEEILTYVVYDSIFNFQKWKNDGLSPSNAIVSNITETGFTLTSNEGVGEGTVQSSLFPVQVGVPIKIDIDIIGTAWDVYIFFYDDNTSSGVGIDFADNATRRFSYNFNREAIFTPPAGATRAVIRVDANGSNNTVSFDNFRIYPADYSYMSTSVAAIDRVDTNSWSIPTPIREGYNFLGWNTKPDGSGETYTSANPYPMGDLFLYSQWEKGVVQISTSVIGEGTISPISAELDAGEDVTFTITPSEYYGIYSITINGVNISPSKTFTLTNVTIDTIVEVVFKKIAPKIVSVILEKDNTLEGIVAGEGVNIIVKVIEDFEN